MINADDEAIIFFDNLSDEDRKDASEEMIVGLLEGEFATIEEAFEQIMQSYGWEY